MMFSWCVPWWLLGTAIALGELHFVTNSYEIKFSGTGCSLPCLLSLLLGRMLLQVHNQLLYSTIVSNVRKKTKAAVVRDVERGPAVLKHAKAVQVDPPVEEPKVFEFFNFLKPEFN